MIIKFKIVSFRETNRIQKSIPMFFTSKGIKSGKEQSRKAWDYQLTDTTGKVWEVYGRYKRGGFRKGQVVLTETRGSHNQWIGKLLTPAEFLKRTSEIIDRSKARIKIEEAEIERVRAL